MAERTLIEQIHQEAADFYTHGDKTRVSLFSGGKDGNIRIRVDGELIDAHWSMNDGASEFGTCNHSA